jgi:hypothetical protein
MDRENIVKLCVEDYLLKENLAYAECLSMKNQHIARLQTVIQTLCQENCRLVSQINSQSYIESQETELDLTMLTEENEFTRPRVRRRLTYSDSESEPDSEDLIQTLDIADEMFRVLSSET